MAEKRNGAGSRVADLLEKAPPEPSAFDPDEPETEGQGDVEPVATPGGGATSRKARTNDARTAGRIKGQTIYLPDDLFERIIVQAHRREKTISEYVTAVLERQVPDHRVIRSEAENYSPIVRGSRSAHI